ncbi:MAG TPA: hypothetical protein DDW94_11040 [Deltaproteobacteria bacterium]|nr:MAG: hypothetical protein A2Z79_11340 [Deltaproteobacteria bacterium GWA2_55_82]OGQ63466.1 MAG: hypothetical protein A3I81_05525 [Deltaproteobacteria bacterium RIFCSPLOWO2_02_FULL_55_12]OIJ74847.1 MAG: hypothetical protein A2V21_311580 [Deltaproteobacteria bacterium GWC2_55_46]HBG47505.1 hypothetical protein [Deltaproteobacteria bacterium]HCY11521.1 hypothetical protein [Deltaproteobacteria bacterium]
MRLDMNEGLPGLPEGVVKEALCGMDGEFLSSYPEYGEFIGKISCHNGIAPENICLSNGSDAAIKYIFDAFVSSGDRVLLTDPSFAMYKVYCEMTGAETVTAEYAGFSFPIENFMEKLSEGVSMAVVVNPNNPSGSVIGEGDLDMIIALAEKNDTLLVIDEAYFYFHPETAISKAAVSKNVIVLRTFSKLCSMAALRLGYAAACPEIIDGLRRVRPTFDVNAVAVRLADRILDEPGLIPGLVRSAELGKEYLLERLSSKGIECRGGRANFVLIRCPGMVGPLMKALEERKILVGGGFKQPFLRDYIRVTVGDAGLMETFCREFLEVWEAASAPFCKKAVCE